MSSALSLDEDRLFPPDPTARDISRRLHSDVAADLTSRLVKKAFKFD